MISWLLELFFGKPPIGAIYIFKPIEKGNPFEEGATFSVTILDYKKRWVKYDLNGSVNHMKYDSFLFCYKKED